MKLSDQHAAVLLFLLLVLLLPVLLVQALVLGLEIAGLFVLTYFVLCCSLLVVIIAFADQTAYFLLQHSAILVEVLLRILSTCWIHKAMAYSLHFDQFNLTILLIQLLRLLDHRSITKILHLISATHHYLSLCSYQFRPHSLQRRHPIEHKSQIYTLYALQHLQTNGSSNRKTDQHYLLPTFSCIFTYLVDYLCNSAMVQTAEKGEIVILMLVSTGLLVEETGNDDGVLVVGYVLQHESHVVLQSVVLVQSDYDDWRCLLDVYIGEQVLLDEGLSALECLF